ncbi:MAG: rubrerythrin family protein [Dehalococcoidia bacterium]|nr:rubrerythrin family protein [Dehalococcoidia bacterium]
MAKSVKGTKTEQNLLKAFAGESQARNRYTYFASIARKEGFEQIANIFTETAENEKEHAKVFFGYLEGGDVEILAAYPAGVLKSTKANLEAAADGEKFEWTKLYADFAWIAKEEGFPEIARSFEQIAKVERFHESRYRKLAANVASGEVFKKKSPVKWHCTNCGYVFEGTEAPKECPACKHPQAFYELLAENY